MPCVSMRARKSIPVIRTCHSIKYADIARVKLKYKNCRKLSCIKNLVANLFESCITFVFILHLYCRRSLCPGQLLAKVAKVKQGPNKKQEKQRNKQHTQQTPEEKTKTRPLGKVCERSPALTLTRAPQSGS